MKDIDIDIAHQLSTLKEIDYKNTLAIASVIEILIEKKLIKKEDLAKKARELDNYSHYSHRAKTF